MGKLKNPSKVIIEQYNSFDEFIFTRYGDNTIGLMIGRRKWRSAPYTNATDAEEALGDLIYGLRQLQG